MHYLFQSPHLLHSRRCYRREQEDRYLTLPSLPIMRFVGEPGALVSRRELQYQGL